MFRKFVQPHCKNLKTQCIFPIMLQSSKSKLPLAGAAKFEMYVVVRSLQAEDQPAIGILSNWSLKIQNGKQPPL